MTKISRRIDFGQATQHRFVEAFQRMVPDQARRVLLNQGAEQAVRLMQCLEPRKLNLVWQSLGDLRDVDGNPDPRVVKISGRFADEHFLRAMSFLHLPLAPGVLTFDRVGRLIVKAIRSDKRVIVIKLMFISGRKHPKRSHYSSQIFRFFLLNKPSLLPFVLASIDLNTKRFLINVNWAEFKSAMMFWYDTGGDLHEIGISIHDHLNEEQREALETMLKLAELRGPIKH